eukprot:XP_014783377.1 PREDICTED: zinc finger protein 726-like [Octopus bimaculoides]
MRASVQKRDHISVISVVNHSLRSLNKHRLVHSDIDGKSFSQNEDLMSRAFIHSRERPYHCDICGSLTTHKRSHTGEKPYHCDVCEYLNIKELMEVPQLNPHLFITRQKPYHCDKTFSLLSLFPSDSYIDKGEKPYQCNSFSQNDLSQWLSTGVYIRFLRIHATK